MKNLLKTLVLRRFFLLKNEEGNVQSDQKLILEMMESYYRDLYNPKANCKDFDGMSFGLEKLNLNDSRDLELPVSLEELYNALGSMNLAKAPGYDGLTVEFYVKFWQWLSPILLEWTKQTVALGKLAGSSSKGILSLIYKKGDPRQLSNWRPITLVSVDVKIFAKALALRLTTVLGSIIPQCQTILPGRTIHSSLSVVRDVILDSTQKKSPLLVLALDQAKAYDNVNHSFLFHLMQVIGLPAYMIRAIKAIYKGYTFSVKNVDSMTEFVPYCQGMRQGDPLSTLLYALVLQPSINALNILLPKEGYLLSNGTRLLVTAYADDITLFLHSHNAVDQVVSLFNYMEKLSGAKLNLTKSEIAGFNFSEPQKQLIREKVSKVPVTFDQISVLGITFTKNLGICALQWTKKIQQVRDKIAGSISFLKNMSYLQRAQWAAKRLWPRWVYLLKTLQPTKAQISQLAVVLAEAVWIGGKHWLDVHDLAVHKESGGLSLVSPWDKIDSLRVMYLVDTLKQGPESPRFLLAESIFNRYASMSLGFRILHSRPDQMAFSQLPAFYRAAYSAWNRLPIVSCNKSMEGFFSMPCFHSRFLEQYDPPLVISISQARSMQVATLEQLLTIESRTTRFSAFAKNIAQRAVAEWMELSKINSSEQPVQNEDEKENLYSEKRVPVFGLVYNESVIPMNAWSSRKIYTLSQKQKKLKNDQEVPKETWKILNTVPSPSVHINYFWRFLHGRFPSSRYFYDIGINEELKCILCGSENVSQEHQFVNCKLLSKIIESLERDISSMGLHPLMDLRQLYHEKSPASKLANFLVVAYIYTIMSLIKMVANSNIQPTSEVVLKMYFEVIIKHITCYARCFPPDGEEATSKWLILTHSGLLAKICHGVLWVRTEVGYKEYCGETHTLL